MPKIIGIVAKALMKSQRNGNKFWDELFINQNFQNLIVSRGQTCIGIIPAVRYNRGENIYFDVNKKLLDSDIRDIKNQINLCDGIILQGGLSQHKIEEFIAEYAIKKNIPILGICAGFDSIVRAVGLGNFIYDNSKNLNDVNNDLNNIYKKHNVYDRGYRHDIFINNSNILGMSKKSLLVNSMHTLMLSLSDLNLNKYKSLIDILAVSHDYLNSLDKPVNHVEAFLVKNTRFALAIKWHPELMPDDHLTKRIFDMFISAV